MKEKVVIVSYSNINYDSRVKRQIQSLKEIYDVIIFGYGNQIFENIKFHKIKNDFCLLKNIFLLILLLTFQFKTYTYHKYSYKKLFKIIKGQKIKAFILNDCFSWPILDFIDKEKSIVDAHEYTPEEFNEGIIWRLIKKRYKTWCSSYVKLAKNNFSVEKNICYKWQLFSGKEFEELRNFSYYCEINNINKIQKPIKITHHGICNKSRKIEYMIQSIIDCGSQYNGYFYLEIKSKRLKNKLIKMTNGTNVNIYPPLKEEELIINTSRFDIAILSIYPSNINYKFCLPNKLFQFIQARLPIVSGPTPSIIEIIKKYRIGIIADSFYPNDLSKAILSLSNENIIEMKKNCAIAAKELCWENENYKLFDKIEQM